MKKWLYIVLSGVLVLSLFYTGGGLGYAKAQGLEPGSANEVRMLQQPLDDIDKSVKDAISEKVMPGAVVLIARDGKIVKHKAYGLSARYKDDNFTEIEHPIETQEDTIYDIASISKLFTTAAVMQLWDKGKIKLDDPISNYIPEFAEGGKEGVTIKQLLTHTSGLRPDTRKPLYNIDGSRKDRLHYMLTEPLKNKPGTHYVYSDVNFMALGVLVERLSGQREDQYVREHITEPLQMIDTMYNPSESLKQRIAPTEYASDINRGLIWGDVHDPNAWALDGIAGNAGAFSTATDLSNFAQMILNKGSYQKNRILSEKAIQLMNTNWNGDFLDQDHGLGWDLNQDWYMGLLSSNNTMGHTGYTGTSIVVNPKKNTTVILLTNRVHPTGDTVSTNPIRKKIADQTATSIYAWSAKDMKDLVNKFKGDNKIKSNQAKHDLNMHLTAVKHYENKDEVDKVIKHMKGFQTLIKHQKNQDLISDEAYEILKGDANYLIKKWQ